ncbi:glycosyltransferase family 4 protein [Heyndrickxia coagulans]|nr:glycosyltransferase family 4 protein [Heyndrickxia coagulans]
MKLLHIFPVLDNGGTEEVIYNISKYLRENQNDIIIGLCAETSHGARRDLFVKSNIKLLNAPKLSNKKSIFSNISSVKKAINSFKPNIVHTHSLYVLIIAYIVKKLTNKKFEIIHTGHGGPSKDYDKLATKFSWMASIYIAISKHSYNYLTENTKKNNIRLINNGTYKPNKDEVLRDLPKGSNYQLKIAFIGRLTLQKGLFTLFEAINILRKYNFNIKLIIIGSGEQEKVLKEYVKENKLNSIIEFKGFVNEPWKVVVGYPIIVMPSLWEPGGLVAIEGIVRNHTVVASNIQGLKDIIIDGENGYLFEKENADDLAYRIKDIFLNNKYINLSTSYREKYLFETSTGPAYWQAYQELFKEI